jgi:hypothetical protein
LGRHPPHGLPTLLPSNNPPVVQPDPVTLTAEII